MSKVDVKSVKSDVQDMAVHFEDEIVRQYLEDGKVSDDLFNGYPGSDRYHHENHFPDYTLLEAATVLNNFPQHEETNAGLWSGESHPKDTVKLIASYTYANAVLAMWKLFVQDINDDAELDELNVDDTPDVNEKNVRRIIKEIVNGWCD